MSHSFKTNSGRTTFGVFHESQDAGEYVYNKKAKTTFCHANRCRPNTTVNTQSNLLLLNRSNFLNYYSCSSFNKSNLNVNLITKLDLTDVPVIQQNNPYAVPAHISTNSIPYTAYTIDPSGNLFGNTICGINNYENYVVYNPPIL